MSSFTLVILGLLIIFWLFCLASAIFNKFKDEKAKVFWVIALLFIPFMSFFYIFLKKDLLES